MEHHWKMIFRFDVIRERVKFLANPSRVDQQGKALFRGATYFYGRKIMAGVFHWDQTFLLKKGGEQGLLFIGRRLTYPFLPRFKQSEIEFVSQDQKDSLNILDSHTTWKILSCQTEPYSKLYSLLCQCFVTSNY